MGQWPGYLVFVRRKNAVPQHVARAPAPLAVYYGYTSRANLLAMIDT